MTVDRIGRVEDLQSKGIALHVYAVVNLYRGCRQHNGQEKEDADECTHEGPGSFAGLSLRDDRLIS